MVDWRASDDTCADIIHMSLTFCDFLKHLCVLSSSSSLFFWDLWFYMFPYCTQEMIQIQPETVNNDYLSERIMQSE